MCAVCKCLILSTISRFTITVKDQGDGELHEYRYHFCSQVCLNQFGLNPLVYEAKWVSHTVIPNELKELASDQEGCD